MDEEEWALYPEFLTPSEVATLFRVDPKTVTRWAKAGRFEPGTVVRTPGNHTRYRKASVRKLLDGSGVAAEVAE